MALEAGSTMWLLLRRWRGRYVTGGDQSGRMFCRSYFDFDPLFMLDFDRGAALEVAALDALSPMSPSTSGYFADQVVREQPPSR